MRFENLKILSIFGTRPEAIKMAPILRRLDTIPWIDSQVCVTGQHREMLESVLSLFRIFPDYDLKLMKPAQDPLDICTGVIDGISPILKECRPDLVLVQGDTTTTLSASLAAFHHRIPVGHVEAGLRTANPLSPWPEEINRRLVSVLSALHFAPTERSRANLLAENVSECSIVVTGNTVVDALFEAIELLDADPTLSGRISERLALDPFRKMILVTGHRRESFGVGFENICDALERLSRREDVQIVYPLHLNPNVKMTVEKKLGLISNIKLISPQEYLLFVHLMRESYFILTDSGGVQEEAPSLGKPVLVMRDTTERSEAVEAGTVKVVGAISDKIYEEASILLDNEEAYKNMSLARNPYGDGSASERIISCILSWAADRFDRGDGPQKQ